MSELMETAKDFISGATIDRHELLEMLSEFLAVERGGIQLYEKALKQVTDPEVIEKFKLFYSQTRRHEELLAAAIRRLGGDPTYMSPAAKIAAEKAHAMLLTMEQAQSLPPAEIQLNAMENIVLAETKDHADWKVLSHIMRRAEQNEIHNAFKEFASEVEDQEDEHLGWTKYKLSQLTLEALERKAP